MHSEPTRLSDAPERSLSSPLAERCDCQYLPGLRLRAGEAVSISWQRTSAALLFHRANRCTPPPGWLAFPMSPKKQNQRTGVEIAGPCVQSGTTMGPPTSRLPSNQSQVLPHPSSCAVGVVLTGPIHHLFALNCHTQPTARTERILPPLKMAQELPETHRFLRLLTSLIPGSRYWSTGRSSPPIRPPLEQDRWLHGGVFKTVRTHHFHSVTHECYAVFKGQSRLLLSRWPSDAPEGGRR
ncbi:hypothetical protein P154DRAFT_224161 [Amniculicola lignicola CBS 123094]|uniref:Uncharacterized protein n=1 Tax=Amniculicola lignicola CBS 123094 TaxID=1392246 RepID=A0A6A5WY56_9PLEO|nr:hypothetical protein P154DRAFT_224161 [Amniculicola lignicola CBS 123094]